MWNSKDNLSDKDINSPHTSKLERGWFFLTLPSIFILHNHTQYYNGFIQFNYHYKPSNKVYILGHV